MADFKEVWSYASSGTKGGLWSEVFYSQASNLQSASTFTGKLISKRLDLLNKVNTLLKIRVSQVGSPRITTVVNIRQNGNRHGSAPATIDNAIVVTLSSSVQPATRRWWLRGWDQADAVRDQVTGNDTFSATFLTDLAAFISSLKDNSYEVLPLQKTNQVGFGYQNIQSVDGMTLPGFSTITLDVAPSVVIGDVAIISQVSAKDLPGLNGHYTVTAVLGKTFTVKYTTPGNVIVTAHQGRVRKLGYISGAIIDPNLSGAAFIGGRKSRSPFTGSRGARSANRRLRSSQ